MAFAGLTIVIGSLFLLYKGILTLQAVSTAVKQTTSTEEGKDLQKESVPPSALAIELGKDIKIQSQYPALGLFILGISCFFGAMYYATQAPQNSVTVEGRVNAADKDKYLITIEGAMDVIRPDIHGNVQKLIPKDVEEVDIKVGKPGGVVDTLVVYPANRENGKLSFGDYPPSPVPQASLSPGPEPTVPILGSGGVAATPTGFPTPLFQK